MEKATYRPEWEKTAELEPLTLPHLFPHFVFLAVGLILGTVVFLMEMFYRSLHSKDNKSEGEPSTPPSPPGPPQETAGALYVHNLDYNLHRHFAENKSEMNIIWTKILYFPTFTLGKGDL